MIVTSNPSAEKHPGPCTVESGTCFCAAFLFGVAALAWAQDVPVYKVDPFWPKPLPNRWSMQQIVDLFVDKNDHIWMINRADPRPDEMGAATVPPRAECCKLGPEIIEFDPNGNVVKGWGTKDYVPGWPGRLQSFVVDRDGNVFPRISRR